jgi:hypothetical protein
MNTENVPVLVGACLCPGAPHEDGDYVYLRPKLGLAAGTVIQSLIVKVNRKDSNNVEEIQGVLAESYLIHGVAEWSLVDEKGPIPVTSETIREHLLSDFERASPVADKADELYMGPVLSPLVKRVAELSATSMTNGSTSVTRTGSAKRRKPSKRS